MVKQGDIIKVSFDPRQGHEQAGWRPAIVVSNDFFNTHDSVTIVCPITNTDRGYPLHIPLEDGMKTTGVILCDQIRALDLSARECVFVEHAPEELLDTVINVIESMVERDTFSLRQSRR